MSDDMKAIQVNWNDKQYDILVDDDSYALLSRHTWYIMYSGKLQKPYAFAELYSKQKGQERVKRMFYMHQMVTGSFTTTDHINGNTLDNRFENLRPATPQQNGWNTAKRMKCRHGEPKSHYKGVSPYKSKSFGDGWQVIIKVTKKYEKPARHVRLGPFRTEIEAARAYNTEIVKHRGEWAYLNQLPEVG